MIHHTILPEELIWEGVEELEKQEFTEISLGGATMVVKAISQQEVEIVRLISPNAQDYLNPELSPGSRIPLTLLLSSS